MSTKRIVPDQPARVVYESPEKRVRIERNSPRDFSLYLDDSYAGRFDFQFQAEAAAGAWMHEQVEALVAELDAAEPTEDDGGFQRELADRQDLGDGLSKDRVLYLHQEAPSAAPEVLGVCEGYTLQTPKGEMSIEMDGNLDFHRRVTIHFPSGRLDALNTAKQLLLIAQLVRRDEVYAALERWVAEDAAANVADLAGRRAA